jgi:hypothetical protein
VLSTAGGEMVEALVVAVGGVMRKPKITAVSRRISDRCERG